jgi:hypothetical protein
MPKTITSAMRAHLDVETTRLPGSLLFDKGNARNFRGEPYVPGSPLTAVQVGRGF